jgi:hypothetical protein
MPLRSRAVIGHMKADGHLGRSYLKGRAGDRLLLSIAQAPQLRGVS